MDSSVSRAFLVIVSIVVMTLGMHLYRDMLETAFLSAAAPIKSFSTPSHPQLHPQPHIHTPKIALLYLSRGPLTLEPIWAKFFNSVATSTDNTFIWQDLFTIYCHPSPGYTFPHTSFFYRQEVSNRVQVEWGQHSVVDAEKRLLEAALADPANVLFVFLSDSCMPLYPSLPTYLQLIQEDKSRINACYKEGNDRQVYRWQPGMLKANITQSIWRKSSQWVSLQRHHAQAVVDDRIVDAVFREECYCRKKTDGSGEWSRFCVSDEHYIPTVLAIQGSDVRNETYCSEGLTYTKWGSNAPHPVEYNAQDALNSGRALIDEMRGVRGKKHACNASELLGLLSGGGGRGEVVQDLLSVVLNSNSNSNSDVVRERVKGIMDGVAWLDPTCPLFARKIVDGKEWMEVLLLASTHW